MKVVILCGGLGARMRTETEFRPKPLVHVGDRPILWHVMRIYAHFGFKEFVLCLGYKGEAIKEYFFHYDVLSNDFTMRFGDAPSFTVHRDDPSPDWTVTCADTGLSTLKGGRVKRIERYIDGDDFFLTYGDGVANIDIGALLEFHRSHGRIATVTGVRPPSLFGELEMAAEGQALSFSEKPQASGGLISGGFFVFNRRIFDLLTPDEDCDLERGPLEKLAADGELMVYRHQGSWECMDTPRDIEHLNHLWAIDEAFWKVWQ